MPAVKLLPLRGLKPRQLSASVPWAPPDQPECTTQIFRGRGPHAHPGTSQPFQERELLSPQLWWSWGMEGGGRFTDTACLRKMSSLFLHQALPRLLWVSSWVLGSQIVDSHHFFHLSGCLSVGMITRASCFAIFHDITPESLVLNGRNLVFIAEGYPQGEAPARSSLLSISVGYPVGSLPSRSSLEGRWGR